MTFFTPILRGTVLPKRLRGMFNLNDPRWGRGGDNGKGEEGGSARPDVPRPDADRPGSNRPGGQKPNNQTPPDLDELWRDLSRKLGGLFGGGGNGNKGRDRRPAGGGGFQPDMKSAGVGIGFVAAVALIIWFGTGFFIVQEGQEAVITRFGSYAKTVKAGFNWRLPYPIERHETVSSSKIRSVDIGRDAIIKATGLRESAMLTEDENIVDIKFAVQYRLKDTRQYLFQSKSPEDAVVQAAETAVREVVGKMTMNTALAEERDQIAPRVRNLMQSILDRYEVGIDIVAVNMQQGGIRPPEQVQAAFDDVLKAGQEREKVKNEAQAYANDVIPRAVGAASRMKEEADAYKSRIVAQAEGDAQRFRSVVAEYQKAPQVTRDRMYIDTMQQVYSSVSKVLVDSRQGSNLMYLPLDKIMQMAGQNNPTGAAAAADTMAAAQAASAAGVPGAAPAVEAAGFPHESRSRDNGRSRDRETR